jgi:hypothetical protein
VVGLIAERVFDGDDRQSREADRATLGLPEADELLTVHGGYRHTGLLGDDAVVDAS